MSTAGIHRGFLRKYGGFMFKQWKEKHLVLTMEGNLLVCRDAESPPDQVVALQTSCESIVEGREILDLPRLPPGGRRDCCFALILPQNKFLLLLTDNPDDCNLWLNLIRKVREGVMSPLTLQRRCSITPCITDRDPLPDSGSEKDPGSPRICEGTPPLCQVTERGGSLRDRRQNQATGPRRPLPNVSVAPPPASCVGLSPSRQQQRCSGGAGGVPADGRGGGLLCSGLPQLLLPLLPAGQPGPGDGPRLGRLLGASCRGLLPRLQPGRRLPALQQLRL
ncbi:uncharacterized protein LOC117772388 isoform X3 [Hippoglossus hippoglossus]|uniref:uncharacterized protein LOC117772388 isoform X3 n=1 Tax=Hippoglossus hippoglossus TaxID=8267 RepID=UPI00148C41D8|nr:uncharacterized protein LOC117772388 isoform X3 [Hippoglossus hippoglossus]